MSNITALECTKDLVAVTAPDGRTWSITRVQVEAIYATKTGSASSRLAATKTDVLNSAQAALGVNQFDALTTDFTLEPGNLNKEMFMAVHA